MRLEGKEQQDLKHGISEEEQVIGSILLLYDTQCKKNILRKLVFKWLGLYQISNAVKEKDIYMFEEFKGLQLACIFAGDKLKKFYP